MRIGKRITWPAWLVRGAGGADLDPHEALVLRLNEQYPGGDVGVLASLFLNRVCLDAGQAVGVCTWMPARR